MLGWLATPTAMTPLQGILGAAAAKKLKEAHGVTTVGGLLTRLPQRYAAQGHSLNVDYGQVGESITAVVEVVGVVKPDVLDNPSVPAKEKRRYPVTVTVTDGVRQLPMPIFGQP